MAQVEIPVVVIDADMRQPTQHKIFQTRNDAGLSTLLSRPGRTWESVAIEPGIPNLRLIPSGPPPPDPADLLDHRLDYLIEELQRAGYFILIDTPPILATSDALIVCGRVDGIVLICRDRHTRIDTLRRAISLVTPAGTRIMGVVLNQHVISGRENHYGAYVGRPDKQGPLHATVQTPPPPPVTRPSPSLNPSDGQ
jgi:capsular exopolysaccharide synthesis family protein